MKGYQRRRLNNGADSYGTWRNGEQITAERVAGKVLRYDHKTGAWNAGTGL